MSEGVISDAGLPVFRQLDDALGLSATAGEILADTRTGKNSRQYPGYAVTQFRQSVFGWLAEYYPATRWARQR